MSASTTNSSTVPMRKALAQSLALSASISFAYFWLSIPSLAQYSLQAFAACFLLYFILKKANQAAIWEVLPTTAVDEMVLVTFAFLLLIGATGGSAGASGAAISPFFSLIFVYLFFVSMTMERWTSIVITLLTLLFFYALSPAPLAELPLSQLAGIPLVMVFFLFAKYQYEQAKEKQTLLQIEHNEVHSYRIFLDQQSEDLDSAEANTRDWLEYFQGFLFGFLQPKLEQVMQMVEFPQNNQAVKGQLTLIRIELEKLKKWLENHS